MSISRQVHAAWLLVAALTASGAETGLGPNLFTFDRMGAGVPAGWRLTEANCQWSAEPQAGPVGPGAARLRFSGKGFIKLESPARLMRPEVAHLLRAWIRGEPGGATVRMRLRDNGFFPEGSLGVPLSEERPTTEQWQPIVLQGKPPRSKGEHYYVELEIAGEDQTVWLDGLYVGEWTGATNQAAALPKLHPAGVVLKPAVPWGLVTGEEPMRAQATVVGATNSGARLTVRAVHTTGITQDLPPLPLDGQPVWKGTIEVTGKPGRLYGMTRIEATVVSATGEPLSAMNETLLARVPPPVPGPLASSPFGIHVGFSEPELIIAAKLGYKWCRTHDASGSTKWGLLERERGKWSWQDEAIALPGKHGLSILGLLDTSPPWASGIAGEGYWSIYGVPRDLDDWRSYVRTVVGRYAGVIDRWEVWNEPWMNTGSFRFFQNGDPHIYQELLKAAYSEARQANPKATIVGIDTYPPHWDEAVLAAGAYPFYDVLSFHRYDHSLHAQPNDAIAFEAARLRQIQAKYGEPKPLELTEGGPDVALYHGSFFSFADERLTGDWQRGADQYSRMFLAVIAAGIQRFTAYSIHGVPRHGDPTHMMVEPGPLLRPLHLTVSALAQFVEGAKYEGRLAPSHDISAHVFSQPHPRYFATEPSTVVALIANGEAPAPLPKPLPEQIRCFDRWGNPTDTPTQSLRGITYLVATGNAQAPLREALKTPPETPAYSAGAEGLTQALLSSFNQGTPPLWSLFSPLGSLAILADGDAALNATRATLKDDPALAQRFRLPGATLSAPPILQPAGASVGGWIELQAGAKQWVVTFSGVPDGPDGSPALWRLVTLTLVPRAGALSEAQLKPATDLLHRWEQGAGKGDVLSLRETLADPPFCVLAAIPSPQVLNNRDYFTTLLNGIVASGLKKSSLSLSHVAGAGRVATALGLWEVDSPILGAMRLGTTATLINRSNTWKLVTLSVGPQLTPGGK
ncbi:MAG: hypothetical protein WCK27_25045 [Verrucomicrobiota bacterium]